MSDEREEQGTPANLPEGTRETLSGRIPQAPEPYAALAPDGLASEEDPFADADALEATMDVEVTAGGE